ncbi:MAG: hypothetical protein IID16_00895 [Candidatus Marinimicrobia bacterium]|nr:hypothetical protein [Candidatus Neomarinimicrobiota bacterium]
MIKWFKKFTMYKNIETVSSSGTLPLSSSQDTKRVFVNIYEDKKGRFISVCDHTTYKDAYESRDDLSTYIETVEIIRTK